MEKSTLNEIADGLIDRGFDRTTVGASHVRPRCSACEILVINGYACHETGCPNAAAAARREFDYEDEFSSEWD